jgi:RNA polymerase sigma-70 factor, ECF subfamily
VDTTSASLLERLRHAGPAASDWCRLHDIYSPLIRSWLSRLQVPAGEADDLAQDVLLVLSAELPRFERQRVGSFRCWVRQSVLNRVRGWRRANGRRPVPGHDAMGTLLSQLEERDSELTRQWDRDHDRYVFDQLLAVVRVDFEPATWEAFRLFAIDGRPADEVAALTGLSKNAIIMAKHRCLKRLRAEAAGMID